MVDAGAVPLLVLCIQEPEISLKRIAASALSDICKHSPEVSGPWKWEGRGVGQKGGEVGLGGGEGGEKGNNT